MMMKGRMEEKRVEEELKHVCRLCSKRYPSGKSLGGHMRSHVIANSNASSSSSSLHKLMKPKKALLAFESNKNGVTVFGGDTNGYGLRENPRKTWRMVDKSAVVVTSNQGRRVCKQCGKSFQSLKALCGHMSSHSERDRNFTRFKDDDEDDEDYEEEEDEDEDHSWASEEEDDGSKGRSARYRAVAVIGCSSNSSGVELEHEQEQEQLAMCLMMLSRDSGQRVGFNFTAESSDNNSVILEGGSTSNFAAKRKHLKFSSEKPNNCANGSVKMSLSAAARKKVNCPELDNSDSGYFENGAKELESDDSADGYSSGGGRNGCKKVKIGDVSPTNSPPHKAGKYQCSICQKSFKTHQALGGHIITHRRDIKNANCNGEYERSAKKTKGHCCPFCPKVFRSGQALGGHKRSHLIGCSPQDKASLIKENRRENHHRLLDLNLPAPVEEDGNGASDGEHGQFKPW